MLVALLALSAVKVWLRPPSPRERSSAHVTIGRPSSWSPSSPPSSPLPAATLPSTRPSTAPALSVPHICRVVIISVDGLRPDVLLRADAPAIRALMNDGSWSMYARAIPYAYTLPAHVSMLTGVSPDRHGVTWNRYIEESYPNVPTLFELAHANGFTTAMATSKMKFITLARPGSLDWQFIADEDHQSDTDVAREAAAIVERHRPQVLFVHLGNVDVVGHATGWGSLQQVRAVHEADVCVGVVVAAMKRAKLYDSTLTILTSDHGGGGRGHGPDDLTSALIPWIAVAPGVAKNFDLTILRGEAAISTMDTFATCAGVLGIVIPSDVEGKPIASLFHHERMMRGVVGW